MKRVKRTTVVMKMKTKDNDKTVPFDSSQSDNTTLLLEELVSSGVYSDFKEEYGDCFKDESFSKIFLEILLSRESDIKKAAPMAGISSVYAYQLISGKRKPSRDTIIHMSINLELGIDDVNKLLFSSGKTTLYVKNKRDSVIIYGLSHGFDLDEINALLRREDLLEL